MMPPSARSMIPLMEESGQTDEERRRLRQKQRNLQKTIESQTEAMEDVSSEVFGKVREENNDLFRQVFYTREAVLDGDNLNMISERAAKQVEGLVQVARYDPMRLTQKLVQKCTRAGQFDWTTLGIEVGTCFNSVPSRVSFLAGPLHADFEPKVRHARAPRTKEVEDDEPEERPEEVVNQEKNADQLSAVERNMKTLNKVLRKRSRETMKQHVQEIEEMPEEEQEAAKKKLKGVRAHEVDAIQYMFNPKSFTQTVENVFHFSFLVKKGSANICVRQDGPKVAAMDKDGNEPDPLSRQAIVPLTMRDWRDFCQAYKLKSCDIPHRTGSKQVNHFKKEQDSASCGCVNHVMKENL